MVSKLPITVYFKWKRRNSFLSQMADTGTRYPVFTKIANYENIKKLFSGLQLHIPIPKTIPFRTIQQICNIKQTNAHHLHELLKNPVTVIIPFDRKLGEFILKLLKINKAHGLLITPRFKSTTWYQIFSAHYKLLKIFETNSIPMFNSLFRHKVLYTIFVFDMRRTPPSQNSKKR